MTLPGPVLTPDALGYCHGSIAGKTYKGVQTHMTPEQEAQLSHLDLEIQIAEKQLRVAQVKKLIAETELDIVGLRQTLQQQLGEETKVLTY